MKMICRCKRGTCGITVEPKFHAGKALRHNGYRPFFRRRGTVAPKIPAIYESVRMCLSERRGYTRLARKELQKWCHGATVTRNPLRRNNSSRGTAGATLCRGSTV